MRRRELLAAGAAAVGGFSGCTNPFLDEYETYSPNEYSFAGLAVIAHGVSTDFQPFALTVEVRTDGEIVTEKSIDVRDAPHEMVLTIYEGLLPHTKYTITLRVSGNSKETATDELRRDPQGRFVGERVGYVFWINDPSWVYTLKPRVVSDDWPESGVDLHPASEFD